MVVMVVRGGGGGGGDLLRVEEVRSGAGWAGASSGLRARRTRPSRPASLPGVVLRLLLLLSGRLLRLLLRRHMLLTARTGAAISPPGTHTQGETPAPPPPLQPHQPGGCKVHNTDQVVQFDPFGHPWASHVEGEAHIVIAAGARTEPAAQHWP